MKRYGFVILLGASLAAAVVSQASPYASAIFCRMAVAAAMAAGLDVCAGLAGQLSLGQAAFMSAGAYAMAVCTAKLNSHGILWGFAGAVAAGAVLAVISGFGVLKLKGDYLSVCTLALGEITRVVAENTSALGGAGGFYNIPRFTNPINSFVVLALCLSAAVWFSKTGAGFKCRAMGQSEEGAKSIGISPFAMKLTAFTLAGVITAVAGGAYAGITGFISPKDFTFSRSVDILAAVVLGGKGTIIGPAAAAMAIELAAAVLQPVANLRMIIYALLLITVTLYKHRTKHR